MESEASMVKFEQIPIPPDMEEIKTTLLKNMTIIEPVNLMSSEELMLIENSDGNLQINTIRTYEEPRGENEDIPIMQGAQLSENDEYLEEDSLIDLMSNEATEFMTEEEEVSTEDDYENPFYTKPDEKVLPKAEESNPCTICEREFKTAATLKRHVIVCHSVEEEQDDPLTFQLCMCCGEPVDSAHMSGDIKCLLCEKLFFSHTSLERHKSMEHSSGTEWCCSECDKTFPERNLLLEHMSIHPISKLFSCRQCNREFTRKYHLERHIAQTGCDGTPRNEYQCQVCEKVFFRKDNLRDHLRAHAGQIKRKKIVECQYCQKTFRGTAMLVMHLRTHTGEKPYPCDLCPKRFPSSGAMKKHRRMHTGEKPYECTKCSNKFAAKETLNRHIRTHTGDKPHACQFCGKSFIQATQLRAHIFHHTGENAYTCTYCNRAFNRRTRLTTHVKFVHEGAKPLECQQCDKTFFRKEDLARHLKLHSGLKPFQCDICQKCFSIKSSLKIHMLTHRKERPCSCDECGRAFIRQDCLLRHMRAKHRDVLEDIMAGAEKKRLQQQLLTAATNAAKSGKTALTEHTIWNELTLTDSIKELLTLLVDEVTLESIGWPNSPVDKLLDAVIKRCGHKPASEEDFDYIGRLRENAKLLFTVVIDDEAVKSLLNNQTVDEVILHVLKLAKAE